MSINKQKKLTEIKNLIERVQKLTGKKVVLKELGGIPTKARMIIMSHLSDVQERIQDKQAIKQINFAKWLLFKYPNTSVDIDADADWLEFKNKFNK